jgi:hypothetical protein
MIPAEHSRRAVHLDGPNKQEVENKVLDGAGRAQRIGVTEILRARAVDL